HLAGSLRESLPDLATRFAGTGLRSEIWKPGGLPAGEWRHNAETQTGNPAQDADRPSRGNGGDAQGDAQQQHPRTPQETARETKINKEKGRDFAWLMSSLR